MHLPAPKKTLVINGSRMVRSPYLFLLSVDRKVLRKAARFLAAQR
jgi:hypothetical protein